VRHHHERYDGRGYPDRLAGEDIPLLGRLMAVADAFSAMTTDRPYRKGMGLAEAVDQLHKGSGTQFDPAMVDAFVKALHQRSRAAA
jgi:HD-GYP domain-containing protein (c-di-GMP phosphodiesterase class II)